MFRPTAVLLGVTVVLMPVARADSPPTVAERYVAVDNVCAWPNLTVLPDGTITAVIFGQPSHGQVAGCVECWVSRDGRFWEKRGSPAPNDPSTNRMNVAAGLAKNGDLVVLCSGWTDLKQPNRPKQSAFRDAILQAWVCRSSDGGRTWTQDKQFPVPEQGWSEFIPFGDILVGEDGALHVSCYGAQFADPSKSTKTREHRSWHFRSDDDGRTWRQTSVIGPAHNETTIVHLGGKRWLAAARCEALDVFRSDDDGATWQGPQRVTQRNEINGHLARLPDGRILLSYGSRVKGHYGVLARLSPDEGVTWGDPITLVDDLPSSDCGYPSSVSLPGGEILTAYYARGAPDHTRYHMGVAIWRPTPASVPKATGGLSPRKIP